MIGDEANAYIGTEYDEEDPYQSYVDSIAAMPLNAEPEVFGMHDNANITCAQNETYGTFDVLLSLQPHTRALLGSRHLCVGGHMAHDHLCAAASLGVELHQRDNRRVRAAELPPRHAALHVLLRVARIGKW